MASYRKRENGNIAFLIKLMTENIKKLKKAVFQQKKLRKLQQLKERKNYYFLLTFQTTLLFTNTLNNGLPFIRNLIFLLLLGKFIKLPVAILKNYSQERNLKT